MWLVVVVLGLVRIQVMRHMRLIMIKVVVVIPFIHARNKMRERAADSKEDAPKNRCDAHGQKTKKTSKM